MDNYNRRPLVSRSERWIYGELLMKRWRISPSILGTFVFEGLPAYDNNERVILDEEDLPGNVDLYRFKMSDVEQFEIENDHMFENVIKNGDKVMDAKDSRELGQLRREKEKWDASIDVAVKIGIYCHEQDRPLKRAEILDQVYEIDKNLPTTTIEKIWKAIPEEYRAKGGRPKKQ